MDQLGYGIVGLVRVGGVALLAVNDQLPGNASPASDFDHVAEIVGAGRFANDTGVESFLTINQPLQDFDSPVDRRPFLVSGYEQ